MSEKVSSSPDVIREMSANLSSLVSEIEAISSAIEKGTSSGASSDGWDDEQAEKFFSLMKNISDAVNASVNEINSAIPKLNSLAEALDHYLSVKFN